jgi:hypothetical protein
MMKRGDRVKLTDKVIETMDRPHRNKRYQVNWHTRQGTVSYAKPGLVLVRWDGLNSDDTWLMQAVELVT